MPDFVKIVSDGSYRDTYIELPNGEKLPGVISIRWELPQRGATPTNHVEACAKLAVATVELYARADVKAALRGIEVEWPGDEDRKANLQED